MNAVGYVRVSTDDQAREGVSLDIQEERIRAYATAAGLDLGAVVREEGVSGTVPLADRVGGAELLGHKADNVIALKLDRLFRDAADALNQTRSWDKAGTALHLIDFGGQAINTASAMGRMFLTMTAAFAEFERNLIAERTAAALQYKKQHLEVYNHTPIGFDRDADRLVVNAGEARTVERIQSWRRKGWPLRKIADRLNDQGIQGKQGGRFYASTIKAILGNDLHAA